MGAVGNVFAEKGVYVGSVKPNVGHSEGSSGLNSLIKCVLALEHKIIPPNIKFNNPNPKSKFLSPESKDGRLRRRSRLKRKKAKRQREKLTLTQFHLRRRSSRYQWCRLLSPRIAKKGSASTLSVSAALMLMYASPDNSIILL